MATANLRSKITMDDSQAQRTLRRFGDSAKRQAGKAQSSFIGAGRAFVGIGAGLATGSVFTRSKNRIEELNKAARMMGTTMGEVQKIKFIATQNTSDLKTYTDGIIRMNRRLVESSETGEKARQALRDMGIDAERFKDLSPVEQIAQLSDGFRSLKNHNEGIKRMFQLMDTGGRQVAAAFTQTGAAIRDTANSVDVMSDESAVRFIVAADKMAAVAEKISVAFDKLTAAGATVIEGWENMAAVAGWAYAAVTVGVDEANAAMKEYDESRRKALEKAGLKTVIRDAAEVRAEINAGVAGNGGGGGTGGGTIPEMSGDDLEIQRRATEQALRRMERGGGLTGLSLLQTRGNIGNRFRTENSNLFPEQGFVKRFGNVPTLPGSHGANKDDGVIEIEKLNTKVDQMKAEIVKGNEILEEATAPD